MWDKSLANTAHSHIMSKEINGSMLWMAPELFIEKPRGRRSDIWSFGCTLIELLTASNPWPEVKEIGEIFDNVIKQKSPKLP
jgi:serine/threonine protein kinase